MNNYEVLKAYGHSPFKALEISLDAKRGDGHALLWLAIAQAFVNTKEMS
jgi:hypothetical protein